MKVQFNKKLLQNINEDNRQIGEILLFLIYREINPIEFFSLYQDGLSKVNYCINIFTRYGIVEIEDNDVDVEFILKRPLFVNEKVSQDRDIDDIRVFFFKSFCGEERRNCQKEVADYIMDKFLEKHPYDWSDIVEVTGNFIQGLMQKPVKDRFIPKFATFVEQNLLVLLEEKAAKDKVEAAKQKFSNQSKEDSTYNDGGFSEFL